MQQLLQAFAQTLNGRDISYGSEINPHGFGVYWEYTDSETDTTWRSELYLAEITQDLELPPSYFWGASEWSSAIVGQNSGSILGTDGELEDFASAFVHYMTELPVFGITGETIVQLSVRAIISNDGASRQLVIANQCNAEHRTWTSVYSVQENANFHNLVPGEYKYLSSFGPAQAQGEAGVVFAEGPALLRIAEAAEVISLQDVEISINHGQAMYSIKGKVTTG